MLRQYRNIIKKKMSQFTQLEKVEPQEILAEKEFFAEKKVLVKNLK